MNLILQLFAGQTVLDAQFDFQLHHIVAVQNVTPSGLNGRVLRVFGSTQRWKHQSNGLGNLTLTPSAVDPGIDHQVDVVIAIQLPPGQCGRGRESTNEHLLGEGWRGVETCGVFTQVRILSAKRADDLVLCFVSIEPGLNHLPTSQFRSIGGKQARFGRQGEQNRKKY